MVQIIREALIDWPTEGPLELVAPAIKVNVTVSPSLARRRANGYLGGAVAMTLLAHNPRLVVGDSLCWRFDVDLSLPGVGVIAMLGAIDVDADSGAALPLSPSQIEEILRRAHALATRIANSSKHLGAIQFGRAIFSVTASNCPSLCPATVGGARGVTSQAPMSGGMAGEA